MFSKKDDIIHNIKRLEIEIKIKVEYLNALKDELRSMDSYNELCKRVNHEDITSNIVGMFKREQKIERGRL